MLERIGFIELPPNARDGGFDHAAVHTGSGRLYVAHTCNDAVDVIDTRSGRYLRSLAGLSGVAGALVDEASGRVFTSNRGEDTVSLFTLDDEDVSVKVGVGMRPNGLAYDPANRLLLSAHVGDPARPGSASVVLVDVERREVIATIPMPGRTRWTVHDPRWGLFYVNIADPAEIVVVDPRRSDSIARRIAVPARGPHGLDLDVASGRLYCACDDGRLVALDACDGRVAWTLPLCGPPDVVFLDRERARLYVAIGEPGLVDVIDVAAGKQLGAVTTEAGAHTIAYEPGANRVYAFLPKTHRAEVFADRA